MDLLSVLLHEYGHVLGIEHSADQHDAMAATLQPGVRRLPNLEAWIALLNQQNGILSAQTAQKTSPPLVAGEPVIVTTGMSAYLAQKQKTATTRYETAANPEFANPQFENGAGWSTTGEVDFSNGAAPLKESADAQTRLNQVFVVGANDRYLSFKLTDLVLDDAKNAPDDAFEAALIDANTGQSLKASCQWQGGR
jgi:hypothetical protein